MYLNYLGMDLAQSIDDAFKVAGWSDRHFSEGSGRDAGISVGPGNGMALALKTTFERTTTLKVRLVRAEETDSTGFVFVAIGIKVD